MSPEENLIKKAAKGDKNAFAEIVDKYKAYIYAIILKFVNDKEQAENIAQETFLQVYISLPGFKHEGFKTWIGRIAVNKAIDWQRKDARSTAREISVDMQTLATYLESNGNPENRIILDEEKERLRDIWAELPEKYQTALNEFYFADKTYKQIAKETGLPEKTIESRLYRARKIIREKWREGR